MTAGCPVGAGAGAGVVVAMTGAGAGAWITVGAGVWTTTVRLRQPAAPRSTAPAAKNNNVRRNETSGWVVFIPSSTRGR